MADYLLDSNVVSDILNDHHDVMRRLEEVIDGGDNVFIPSIVYYEVVRGLKAAGKTSKLMKFQDLYQSTLHLDLDMPAVEKAIEIYMQLHKGKLIEDNDIYIAAISIVNGCTLITSNTNHFGRVEGLSFVNWRTT